MKYIFIPSTQIPNDLVVEHITGDALIAVINWLEDHHKGYEFVTFYSFALIPFFLMRLKCCAMKDELPPVVTTTVEPGDLAKLFSKRTIACRKCGFPIHEGPVDLCESCQIKIINFDARALD